MGDARRGTVAAGANSAEAYSLGQEEAKGRVALLNFRQEYKLDLSNAKTLKSYEDIRKANTSAEILKLGADLLNKTATELTAKEIAALNNIKLENKLPRSERIVSALPRQNILIAEAKYFADFKFPEFKEAEKRQQYDDLVAYALAEQNVKLRALAIIKSNPEAALAAWNKNKKKKTVESFYKHLITKLDLFDEEIKGLNWPSLRDAIEYRSFLFESGLLSANNLLLTSIKKGGIESGLRLALVGKGLVLAHEQKDVVARNLMRLGVNSEVGNIRNSVFSEFQFKRLLSELYVDKFVMAKRSPRTTLASMMEFNAAKIKEKMQALTEPLEFDRTKGGTVFNSLGNPYMNASELQARMIEWGLDPSIKQAKYLFAENQYIWLKDVVQKDPKLRDFVQANESRLKDEFVNIGREETPNSYTHEAILLHMKSNHEFTDANLFDEIINQSKTNYYRKIDELYSSDKIKSRPFLLATLVDLRTKMGGSQEDAIVLPSIAETDLFRLYPESVNTTYKEEKFIQLDINTVEPELLGIPRDDPRANILLAENKLFNIIDDIVASRKNQLNTTLKELEKQNLSVESKEQIKVLKTQKAENSSTNVYKELLNASQSDLGEFKIANLPLEIDLAGLYAQLNLYALYQGKINSPEDLAKVQKFESVIYKAFQDGSITQAQASDYINALVIKEQEAKPKVKPSFEINLTLGKYESPNAWSDWTLNASANNAFIKKLIAESLRNVINKNVETNGTEWGKLWQSRYEKLKHDKVDSQDIQREFHAFLNIMQIASYLLVQAYDPKYVDPTADGFTIEREKLRTAVKNTLSKYTDLGYGVISLLKDQWQGAQHIPINPSSDERNNSPTEDELEDFIKVEEFLQEKVNPRGQSELDFNIYKLIKPYLNLQASNVNDEAKDEKLAEEKVSTPAANVAKPLSPRDKVLQAIDDFGKKIAEVADQVDTKDQAKVFEKANKLFSSGYAYIGNAANPTDLDEKEAETLINIFQTATTGLVEAKPDSNSNSSILELRQQAKALVEPEYNGLRQALNAFSDSLAAHNIILRSRSSFEPTEYFKLNPDPSARERDLTYYYDGGMPSRVFNLGLLPQPGISVYMQNLFGNKDIQLKFADISKKGNLYADGANPSLGMDYSQKPAQEIEFNVLDPVTYVGLSSIDKKQPFDPDHPFDRNTFSLFDYQGNFHPGIKEMLPGGHQALKTMIKGMSDLSKKLLFNPHKENEYNQWVIDYIGEDRLRNYEPDYLRSQLFGSILLSTVTENSGLPNVDLLWHKFASSKVINHQAILADRFFGLVADLEHKNQKTGAPLLEDYPYPPVFRKDLELIANNARQFNRQIFVDYPFVNLLALNKPLEAVKNLCIGEITQEKIKAMKAAVNLVSSQYKTKGADFIVALKAITDTAQQILNRKLAEEKESKRQSDLIDKQQRIEAKKSELDEEKKPHSEGFNLNSFFSRYKKVIVPVPEIELQQVPDVRSEEKEIDLNIDNSQDTLKAIYQYVDNTAKYAANDRSLRDSIKELSPLVQHLVADAKLQSTIDDINNDDVVPEIENVRRFVIDKNQFEEQYPVFANIAKKSNIQTIAEEKLEGKLDVCFVDNPGKKETIASYLGRHENKHFNISVGKLPDNKIKLDVNGEIKIPPVEYLLAADKILQLQLQRAGHEKRFYIRDMGDPLLIEALVILCERNGVKNYRDESGKFGPIYKKPDIQQMVFAHMDKLERDGTLKLSHPYLHEHTKTLNTFLRKLPPPMASIVSQDKFTSLSDKFKKLGTTVQGLGKEKEEMKGGIFPVKR